MATPSIDFNYAIEERNVPGKGRCLFARRPFKEKDVIFEETPLVCCQFLWNKLYGYHACSYCMRPLETAEENAKRLTDNYSLQLPHPECCVTKKEYHVICPRCQDWYCCVACQVAADKSFHQVLCLGDSLDNPNHPLEKLQKVWREIHYPPETSSIMLIAQMIAKIKQSSNKEELVSRFSHFHKNTVNVEEQIAHKLLGDQFTSQLNLLREHLSQALYDKNIDQWFTVEGFKTIFALIGTNGQGVGTSPLSQWVKNCDQLDLLKDERTALDNFIDQLYQDIEKHSGIFINNEGSALYTLQSVCNHSCKPNAEPAFPHNNFTLVMIALQDIQEGEEICISYLDECALNRSRHSRIKILRENYLFTCKCEKCEQEVDQPDVTSSEEEEDDNESIDSQNNEAMDQ